MLLLEGNDLLRLKGAGGERFTRFVDSLIRAEAHLGGLPQSEIDTQFRVNVGDGGVDTRVNERIPKDSVGYFEVPTCWQYKAETAAELEAQGTRSDPLKFLTEEITKPEARRLIGQGYGYRFCFLGDLTPKKMVLWEGHLAGECRKLNADAPRPRVVAADKLAAWAGRFPAVASWCCRSLQRS